MSDYDRTLELVNVAQNSAGRADEQFAKYADTVEYRVNKLKNSWEAFRTSLVSSDVVKSFLTVARTILNFVTELTNSYWKLIPTIINVVGLLRKFKNSFEPLKNQANKFLESFKKAFEDAKIEEKVTVSMEEGGKEIEEHIKDGADYHAEKIKAALEEKEFNEENIPKREGEEKTENENEDTNTDIQEEIGEETEDIKTELAAMLPKIQFIASSALKAFEIGLIGNSFLQTWMKDDYEKENEQWNIAVEKINSQFNTSGYTAAAITTQNLEEARDTIQELSTQTYLSAEQQEKLASAISLMNDTYPEYVASYDENTGKIELLTEKIDEEIEVQKQQNQYLLEQNLGKIGYNKTEGYDTIYDMLTGKKTSGSELVDFQKENEEVWTSTEVAGTATALGTIAALAAKGGALGSVSGPLGAVLGAVTGTIIGGITAVIQHEQLKNTITPNDLVTKVGALDTATQSKVFDGINQALKTSIETTTELSEYLDNNRDDLGEILSVTTQILEEVSNEAQVEGTVEAVQQAIKAGKYGNAQVELTDKEVKLLHDESTSDFEGTLDELTKKYSKGDNILSIFAKERDELDNFTDLTELSQTMTRLDKIEGFSWVRQVIKVLDDLDNLPHEFQDLKASDREILAPLEDEWASLVPTGGIDNEDNYHEEFAAAIVKMAFGKEAMLNVQENFQTALDTALNDNSGLLDEAREWVDATNKASGLTLKQFNDQRKDMLKRVSSHVWSSNPEIQKQIVDWVTNLITGITPSGEVIENSSSDIQNKLGPKIAKLKEYFSDSLINSLSIEANNALELVMSKGLSNDNWNKIADIINAKLLSIPDSIGATAKTSLQNYTIEQLSPETFDPLKIEEYTTKISAMTKSTKEATKYVSDLYALYKSNNIDTVPHTFEEISTAMDDTTKSTKNLLSSWQTFFKVWQNSLTSTGASSTDILSLGENPLVYAVNEDGSIDLQKAYGEYDASLQDKIAAIDIEYRETLEKANGDQALITQAEIKRQANLVAIKTELLNLDDELAKVGEDYEKKLEKASQAHRKALDDERKAIKKLTEAIKEQNEAYNGSDTWVAQVSGTFELDNAYQRLTADAEMYNLKLKDAKDLTDALALSSQKNQNLHEQDVNNNIKLLEYQAADKAILANINKLAAEQGITDPFNMTQIYNDNVPDSIRDRIVKMLETHENYNTEMQKLEKESLEREQKYNEDQKALLDKRVKFLQDGANIMKEAAEKEVKDLKNKYEAMKDADDQYLDALEDAIKRQRNLREREKEANDLAQKEKKLSLISRDTSGANEKERLKLEKELQTDRQKYLDNTIDDIIDELKRQSEEREKERQAVVDATEAINESTNWVQQFCNISESWTTQAEVAGWFDTMIPALSVNKTPEEIQQMQNNLNQSWTEQLPYLALSKDELTEFTKATMDEVVAQQENYHTTLQEMEERTTQKALDDLQKLQENADDAATSAQDALTTAQETVETTKKELDEANTVWQNYLADTKILTSDYMKEMVDNYVAAIDEMLKKNAEAGLEAARQKITEQRGNRSSKADSLLEQYNSLDSSIAKNEFLKTAAAQGYGFENGQFKLNNIGIEKMEEAHKKSLEVTDTYNSIKDSKAQEGYKENLLNNGYIYQNGMFQSSEYQNWAEEYQLLNGSDLSQNLTQAISTATENLKTADKKITAQYLWNGLSEENSYTTNDGWGATKTYKYKIVSPTGGEKYTDMESTANRFKELGYIVSSWDSQNKKYNKYASGGLVSYTGPAWVDGSPTRPEAFLSPEDTRRIGEAAKLLSLSPFFNSSQTPVSSSVGDTSIEININVEQISSDYDVDQLVERVHQDILDAARPTGTPVILRKN